MEFWCTSPMHAMLCGAVQLCQVSQAPPAPSAIFLFTFKFGLEFSSENICAILCIVHLFLVLNTFPYYA
jgi:hypothetical protein